MKYYLLTYAMCFLIGKLSCEFFTSIEDMETLLQTQSDLLKVLDKHISTTENNIGKLKNYLESLRKEHDKASRNPEEYLYNPINAFLTIKRLTVDREEIEALINEQLGSSLLEEIYERRANGSLLFPKDEDLTGATSAIKTIQKVYGLGASEIARGKFNGAKLSGKDCFAIGKHSYETQDYPNAESWLSEARTLYHEENETPPRLLLEYLSFSYFAKGDLQGVMKIIHEMFPENETESKKEYAKEIWKRKREFEGTTKWVQDFTDLRICNPENLGKLKEKVKAKLKCRYTDMGKPFLKLARVKEEEALLNPKIFLYHDILYDNEIQIIKNFSKPELERATVYHAETGERVPAPYRTSKSAWFDDDYHPLMKILNRRIEDITGLTTETGESLQVGNYGIAGHYATHYDFFEDVEGKEHPFKDIGNRVATVLIYMTDVAQGGETVFRDLTVSVTPKKGMAVFWYNLLPSGERDRRMIHTACPVLLGNKWVSNKWLHERGQEFRRPCGLTEDAQY